MAIAPSRENKSKVGIVNGSAKAKANKLLGEVLQTPRNYNGLFTKVFSTWEDFQFTTNDPEEREEVGKLGRNLLRFFQIDVLPLGDIYDHAQTFKHAHQDANEAELARACKAIGRRVFNEISREVVHFLADGKVANIDTSFDIWTRAFGISPNMNPPMMLEIKEDEEGNRAISHIWGLAPDATSSTKRHYERLLQEAQQRDSRFFTHDVKISFVTTMNSPLARESNKSDSLVELPLSGRDLLVYAYTMITDDTPTSDSATRLEQVKFFDRQGKSFPLQVFEYGRRQVRMLAQNDLPANQATKHQLFSGASETLQERLQSAWGSQNVPDNYEDGVDSYEGIFADPLINFDGEIKAS